MMWHSRIFAGEDVRPLTEEAARLFVEKGEHLFRFAYLAADEVLVTARKWRNDIERQGVGELDLAQAERELENAVRGLKISLYPPVVNGVFVDPHNEPNWRDLPNVERVDIAGQLARARGGLVSAFGFSEQSGHEVVYQMGCGTQRAIEGLAYCGNQLALDFALGPESPLRTEFQGLGSISAAETNRVKAELWEEFKRGWEVVSGGGKTALDSADKIKKLPDDPQLIALLNAATDNQEDLARKKMSLNKLALKITDNDETAAKTLTRNRRRWLAKNKPAS